MERGSIKVKLVGGLGNQLFIWAAAYAICKKKNLNLIIDASECTQRGYELDFFGIEADIKPLNAPDGVLPTRFPNAQNILIRQFRIWRKYYRFFRIGRNFWERPGGFDRTVFDISAGKTMRGYFQSFKYFEDFSQEIQSYLTTNWSRSKAIHELLGIVTGRPWVAIHVRRGDYETMQSVFGLTGNYYYKEALKQLDLFLPNAKKYVFSDDIAQAKLIVPGCDGYIGNNELGNACETLLLMSKANAIIGSNSSFSWWAAYLMKAEDHLKIFPNPWFIDKKLNNIHLVPPTWTSISISLSSTDL